MAEFTDEQIEIAKRFETMMAKIDTTIVVSRFELSDEGWTAVRDLLMAENRIDIDMVAAVGDE